MMWYNLNDKKMFHCKANNSVSCTLLNLRGYSDAGKEYIASSPSG